MDPTMLEQPKRRWGSISMDFIQGLPPTKNGFDTILTFVDRFSKRPHFIPCKSTTTAPEVPRLFYDQIFRYHGLPDSIVSDRDPLFTSKFWKELLKILKVQLKMGTANHPQTDGQTEVMNRIVEQYLRIYCSYRRNDWDQHLSAAEFAYSSSKFSATGLTPFMMDLGWTPRTPIDFLDSALTFNVQSVEENIISLSEIFKDVQQTYAAVREQQLSRSKNILTPPNYQVGDRVMGSTSAIRDHYTRERPSTKLTARRIGPFQITQLIGENPIRLNLRPTVRVHPVINVSHTVPYYDEPEDIAAVQEKRPDPIIGPNGLEYEPEQILQHRKKGRGHQFLVQWKGYPTCEASWKPIRNFIFDDGVHELLPAYVQGNALDDDFVIQKGMQ